MLKVEQKGREPGVCIIYCFIISTLVSSVGRAWDCSEKSSYPKVSGSSPERGILIFLFCIFYREVCTVFQLDESQIKKDYRIVYNKRVITEKLHDITLRLLIKNGVRERILGNY